MANHRLDHSPFLVKPSKKLHLKDFDPRYTAGFKSKAEAKKALLQDVSDLADAQSILWASRQYAVLIILQALDAAGKDSAIKHVMSGVNPQGVDVHAFRAPNEEELLHPFLWRAMIRTPAFGRMTIFNRSYYEEVLVVRVHPEFLGKQQLPRELSGKKLDHVWESRYEDIKNFERFLTKNNTMILKFFLNVSRKEQKKRFMDRLERPDKHWKFSSADVQERQHWDEYMVAYEEMLSATSTEYAPWYVVPADKKWFTRACVADIIASRIDELDLKYPEVSKEERTAQLAAKQVLENEDS